MDATFKHSLVKQIQKILERRWRFGDMRPRHTDTNAYRTWKKNPFKSMDVWHYRHVRYKTTFKPFWTVNNKIRSVSLTPYHALLFRVPPASLEIPSSAYRIYIQSTSPFSYWIWCYELQFLPILLRGQVWFCLLHVENILLLSTRHCFAVGE